MKTILLHVGTHKTGSTSLQATFHRDREILLTQGIAYLGGAGAYPHLYSAFLSDPMRLEWNVLSKLSEREIRSRDQNILAKLSADVETSSCDTIIISSEYLAMLQRDELQALKNYLEPHGRVIAIYYYRELFGWMSSDSQQLAKVGLRRRPTLYETAIERVYDMPLRVFEVFGSESTRFIRFEDAVKTGICNSFLSEFGLRDLSSMGITEVHANESISANAVRAMFLYNRLFPLGGGQRDPKVIARLRALDGPKYTIAGLTEDQIRDYAEKRTQVSAQLGLRLQAPEQLPISDALDPMVEELLRMVNRRLRQEQQKPEKEE